MLPENYMHLLFLYMHSKGTYTIKSMPNKVKSQLKLWPKTRYILYNSQKHTISYQKRKIRENVYCHIMKFLLFTSPNAPLPITVNCSKSSIPTLRLCSLMYSVSFRSKFLSISSCSSLDTWASSAFIWSARRLKHSNMKLNYQI